MTRLDQIDDLAASSQELADRLELHAAAEEQLFHPTLARAADDGAEEGLIAVRDHNDIRHAVTDVAATPLACRPAEAGSTAQPAAVPRRRRRTSATGSLRDTVFTDGQQSGLERGRPPW